jgi:aminopeptidase N
VAGAEYVRGQRKGIENISQMIGTYDVNMEGADLYNKGANMLHTIRQIVNNDEKWRTILRGINSTFYHQTVTTKQIEDYLSKTVGLDLKPFFDQYLRDIRIPKFEYKFDNNTFSYRWANCNPEFNMPLKVSLNGKEQWLKPQTDWISMSKTSKDATIEVDKDFYVEVGKSK